jgi:hypothetical protein
MAYSIESTTARRCTTNLNGQQCGLAEHHIGDHVTPDGRQRWPQSIFAPLAEAWGGRIGHPTAGQKVTADLVSEYAASMLSDRISAVAQRVESEIPLREALVSRLDELAGQLAAETAARTALSVELVTTRSQRLSPLEDRVLRLELAGQRGTPTPDRFQRCDVSVPKQCVLQLGHGGYSHVSNSGTMWPMVAQEETLK